MSSHHDIRPRRAILGFTATTLITLMVTYTCNYHFTVGSGAAMKVHDAPGLERPTYQRPPPLPNNLSTGNPSRRRTHRRHSYWSGFGNGFWDKLYQVLQPLWTLLGYGFTRTETISPTNFDYVTLTQRYVDSIIDDVCPHNATNTTDRRTTNATKQQRRRLRDALIENYRDELIDKHDDSKIRNPTQRTLT